MATINPYKDVNWPTNQFIQSMSHEHHFHIGTVQQAVDQLHGQGFRHFAFSEYLRERPPSPNFPEDYYGSAPIYPLSRWYENHPSDIVSSPNIEALTERGHTIALGTKAGIVAHNCPDFSDDTFPCNLNWQNSIWDVVNNEKIVLEYPEVIKYLLDGIEDPNNPGETIGGLLYPDAGGLYPAHTGNLNRIITALDFDDRVLGSDMYSDRRDNDDPSKPEDLRGYQVNSWDIVLASGRRCWGFAESDRGRRGCNILLLDDFTNHSALKAYREGNFYCKMAFGDTGLKFKKIIDHGHKIEVETEGADNGISIVTESGIVAETNGNTIEYTYPLKNGEVWLTYLRVEARGPVFTNTELPEADWPLENYRDGVRYQDEIYSQPIMWRTRDVVEQDRILRIGKLKGYVGKGII